MTAETLSASIRKLDALAGLMVESDTPEIAGIGEIIFDIVEDMRGDTPKPLNAVK